MEQNIYIDRLGVSKYKSRLISAVPTHKQLLQNVAFDKTLLYIRHKTFKQYITKLFNNVAAQHGWGRLK